jgi:hypothetical protein
MTVLARASNNLTDRPTELVSFESVASQQGREHGTRAISTVRSRYQTMTSENIEHYVCFSYSDL